MENNIKRVEENMENLEEKTLFDDNTIEQESQVEDEPQVEEKSQDENSIPDSEPELQPELEIEPEPEPKKPLSEKPKAVEEEKPKERAGAILKQHRERQGIALDVVHEATKIPMDALRAIEEGYTVRMLTPFYYSGFVKMYADFLHINISEVLDDYKQEALPEVIEQEVDIPNFKMPEWVTKSLTRQRKQQIVLVVGAILALFIFFKIVGFLFSLGSKPNVPAEQKIEKAEPVVKKKIKTTAKKPVKRVRQETPKLVAPKPVKRIRQKTPKLATPKPVKKVVPPPVVKVVRPIAAAAPVAAMVKNVNLTVRSNQNSWLRVKSDGVVVFQSTLRTGSVETWLADKEIEISGRNINQLEFELNGKMIGMLGRKDRNAKKVVVTKRGLTVKQ